MSLIRSFMAKGGMSFAHLGGVKAGPTRAAESDKDDDDDKSGKGAKADDDEPKKQDDDSGKGSKAEGDDGDKGEGDDGDDDGDDKPKSTKRSKASSDDSDAEDDDEEEMRGNSAAASARKREQARCAAIFHSQAAGRNPVLAANLAFNSRMTRREAITVLEGTPAPARAAASHPDRAASNPRVDPPGAPEQNAHATQMSSWDAVRARNKAQGG